MEQTKPVADTKTANPNGIVSVNSRGGSSSNLYGKLAFILMVLAIIAIGALLGFNKYRAAKKSEQTAAEQSAKYENKPATVGQRRSFDTDPPPLPPNCSLLTAPRSVPVRVKAGAEAPTAGSSPMVLI